MSDEKVKGLKPPAFAALALAFASLGDAFLYPFLPVNFAQVGVPLMAVGLLLSVNRFVRIFVNGVMVHACSKYGLRFVMIAAVMMAIVSTMGYGVADGIWMWLLFRILWGLAFSAMRIGALGYALQHERHGISLGVSRSLQEAGPVLSLFLAPVLLQHFEADTVFFLLALFSLPALYFAFSLPVRNDGNHALPGKASLGWPSLLNLITFVLSIVIDGIIVVTLGVLLIHLRNMSAAAATTLAAFYLGYRRICMIALSPAGGWVADKIGLDRVFSISMLLLVSGLIVMAAGWIGTGAVIVFAFHSINAAITPGFVSRGRANALAAVAGNATWRDIGAAVGTLAGGFLISAFWLHYVLLGGIFVLIVMAIIHLRNSRPVTKHLWIWK